MQSPFYKLPEKTSQPAEPEDFRSVDSWIVRVWNKRELASDLISLRQKKANIVLPLTLLGLARSGKTLNGPACECRKIVKNNFKEPLELNSTQFQSVYRV